MILLIAAALVLAFSLFTTSLLRLSTRPAVLLGLYLLSYANIVLVCQVAGTAFLLDSRVFFLIAHLLLAGLACFAWWRAGRPSLLGPFSNFTAGFNTESLWSSIKTWPDLWVLGLGVGIVYLVGAVVILIMPPNNWDSMAYNMSRVGYWLQHGSLYPWPAPYVSQTVYPINGQVQALWTVLFWGSDQLVEFVQWLAVPAGMLAIFGLARLLGWSRAQAIFSALIWATFTEVVLESTTTQNHLVVSGLFVSMLYLLYLGLRSNQRGALLLSGLGLGLAIGTHQLIFLSLPGLALAVGIIWLRHGRTVFRSLVIWAGASLAAFLLVGSYMYWMNLFLYGHPAGDVSLSGYLSADISTRLGWLSINLPQFLYQSADLNGLPYSAAEPLQKLKAQGATQLYPLLGWQLPTIEAIGRTLDNVYTHEDLAWFGPLSFLLLLPAMLYQLWVGLTRKEPYRVGLVLIALSQTLGIGALFRVCIYISRYFTPVFTVCAPLLAPIFRPGRLLAPLRWVIVALALLVAGSTITLNEARPLTGPRAIWERDRIGRLALNRPDIEAKLRMIEGVVPRGATLGTVLRPGDWDYPLFGERFERTVIQIFPPAKITDQEWLAEQKLDFILVGSGGEILPPPPTIPADFFVIIKDDHQGRYSPWILLGQEVNFAEWQPEFREQLLSTDKAPQNAPLLTIYPPLLGHVGVNPSFATAQWGLEKANNNKSTLWLGNGDQQGVRNTLWSDAARTAFMRFDVEPGPAREDSQRTVELALKNEAGLHTERQQFDHRATLSFGVELQPGPNEFMFKVLEEATANDPNKTMLVLLHYVAVISSLDQVQAQQAGPPGAPLLTVDSSLAGVVGIDPQLQTPPWGIEVADGRSQLWLGHGQAEGLHGVFWSAEKRTVNVAFDIEPGPAREDNQRTIELTLENEAGIHRLHLQFERQTTLEFSMELQPGPNKFGVRVVEEATQSNGAGRTLLALLFPVKVTPAD